MPRAPTRSGRGVGRDDDLKPVTELNRVGEVGTRFEKGLIQPVPHVALPAPGDRVETTRHIPLDLQEPRNTPNVSGFILVVPSR